MKMGLLNLLGIIFVTLKLAQVGSVATWSWWAVLSPFWISGVIWVFVFVVLVLAETRK